ncbi:DUF551 domain-containing protein [Escherichia coli]|nr:DUF551 domain-containing protein [Escherichia coli]UHR05718.1 DUF551 domain-containing protein [Escherichia coli]
MTTITKERLLTIKQWRETYGPGSNVVLPAEEAEELARIAQASLEAEPVAWKTTFTQIGHECNTYTVTYFDKAEAERWVHIHNITGEFRAEVVPLYTAPPVSIVQLPFEQWLEQQREKIEVDCGCVSTETLMHWMRVAYEAGNYPVIPDGWISCSERMPDNNHDVLFFDVWGYIRIGWFSADDRSWFTSDDGCCMEVTHWMPLPEPPQEAK